MIVNRFSAAASTYDRHAQPQLSLAQSVCDALPELCPERILELGCGTGQLTRLLLERFPGTPIDAVDLSDEMLAYSRQEFKHAPQVHWIHGDAQTWRGENPYPLIVSSSALHWTADLPNTLRNLRHCLKKEGCCALGMMLSGTLKELQAVRREIAPHKTPPVPLPTLEHLVGDLHAAGFQILRRIHSEEQVAYNSATGFLQAIHEQGVTGTRATGQTLLTRGELTRLIETYQERFNSVDGVTATYETATLLLALRSPL